MKKLAVAVALASCALSGGVTEAHAATCSSSGGFTTCKYWDGYMPAYANGLPYYAGSGSNYWYTNRMWRPVNHWATVAFVNSNGIFQGTRLQLRKQPICDEGKLGL